MKDWKKTIVSPETSLREAMSVMDRSGVQIAMVMDCIGQLHGVLTDGDVRRAILCERDLNTPTSQVMNHHPHTAPASYSNDQLLSLMRRHWLHHIPLVDENRRGVGLVILEELVGVVERTNWVVLMAGGLGTRLRPLTDDCPKPLLTVSGKPILEGILESFIEKGFRRFFFAVNYKSEMIREYFGGGERWGVRIEYLQEDTRLGTAGALSLLPERPSQPLIVMNGDLLTRADFDSILAFHLEQKAVATMAVREYDFQVPYGVVRVDGTRITALEEKPVQRFFVNAGIYVLSAEALDNIPRDAFFDMPTLFERLTTGNQLTSAYPLHEYWLDIGRLDEFERAQREWLGPSK